MGHRRRRTLWGLMGLALTLALALGLGTPWQGMAQTADEPAVATPIAAPLPALSGDYADPQQRFTVGILTGYEVSMAGGAPLFQAPDGSLAYTVVAHPLGENTPDPLPEVAVVQIATDIFGQGEAFQTTGLSALAGGGLQIDWTGRLSQQFGPPLPVEGRILAKQQGQNLFLLMVAGVNDGMPQLADASALLSNTLKVP